MFCLEFSEFAPFRKDRYKNVEAVTRAKNPPVAAPIMMMVNVVNRSGLGINAEDGVVVAVANVDVVIESDVCARTVDTKANPKIPSARTNGLIRGTMLICIIKILIYFFNLNIDHIKQFWATACAAHNRMATHDRRA